MPADGDAGAGVPSRLRALYDLSVAGARESIGRHEYDGVVQDLSPTGVAAGLARLGDGPEPTDAYDTALLRASEEWARHELGELQEHRRSPFWHISNLDVSCYDRDYAPLGDREAARRRHLSGWPDAVDAAVESLDRVPAPVAAAMLSSAEGLAAGVPAAIPEAEAALAAHARFVAHVRGFAESGEPDASLGAEQLAALMGAYEATPVDLGRLGERADAERDRLRELLAGACAQLRPGAPSREVIAELVRDHPTEPEEIYAEAREQIDEATRFALERDLIDEPGGECLVGPAPPARRWAMAMMAWAAPYEPDAPSWYHVTPPDPEWSEEERRQWLQVFSRTTLPAITVHEVTPGHFAHARFMRRLESDYRRSILSYAFVEGWAHYAEELFVEEGFRGDDPRFTIGVCIEALIRVTRLASTIGIHSGAMDVDEATQRFSDDAFIEGPAARQEAERATYDPGYGAYTWGKLAIRDLRDRARREWGSGFSHRRFHHAMLDLGAPPLGLLDHALATTP